MSERKCERIMRKTMFTYVFVLGRNKREDAIKRHKPTFPSISCLVL